MSGSPTCAGDSRFGWLWATNREALSHAPHRRQRRSAAAISHSASEGSLYPSVAVRPQFYMDFVGQHDGMTPFHSAYAAREPIGQLSPYIENEMTRAMLHAARQHGPRHSPSAMPASAEIGSPTHLNEPASPTPSSASPTLLPSMIYKELWRPSKGGLSRAPSDAAYDVMTGDFTRPTTSTLDRAAESSRRFSDSRKRLFPSDEPALVEQASVSNRDFGSPSGERADQQRRELGRIRAAGRTRSHQGSLLHLGAYDVDDFAMIARRSHL